MNTTTERHNRLAWSTSRFKKIAHEVHGRKFDYSNVVCTGRYVKVHIICRSCGSDFYPTASNHLFKASGCPTCWGSRQADTKVDFVAKAKAVHGGKYTYRKVQYVNGLTKVQIYCTLCKEFFDKKPKDFLLGYGHLKCAKVDTKSEFVAKAKTVHGDKYSYKFTKYVHSQIAIHVQCRTCKVKFEVVPTAHLMGRGCISCNRPRKHSKVALSWLDYEAAKRGIEIKHAYNGGEFKIPGTRFHVDGYNQRTNTVFEFHGDNWHGNPDIYSPRSRPNPFKNKTAYMLYKETLEREDLIRSLGYKLVVMWENDWRKLMPRIRTKKNAKTL